MHRSVIQHAGVRVLVTDTITILETGDAGAVVVSGSHGGVSSAQFATGRGLRGVAFNDAGVGKDEAGVAGLAVLDGLGLPAVAVEHLSAAIGDGPDTWENGVVGRANDAAAALGVVVGMPMRAAAAALGRGPDPAMAPAGPPRLHRRHVYPGVPVLLLDSISMLQAEDAGRIVVSGSHGAEVSAAFALRHRPLIVAFNDAGIGRREAGCAAIDPLGRAGVAAVAVDFRTGRIGDPADMLGHGVVSRANAPALAFGLRPGLRLREGLAALGRPLAQAEGRTWTA